MRESERNTTKTNHLKKASNNKRYRKMMYTASDKAKEIFKRKPYTK